MFYFLDNDSQKYQNFKRFFFAYFHTRNLWFSSMNRRKTIGMFLFEKQADFYAPKPRQHISMRLYYVYIYSLRPVYSVFKYEYWCVSATAQCNANGVDFVGVFNGPISIIHPHLMTSMSITSHLRTLYTFRSRRSTSASISLCLHINIRCSVRDRIPLNNLSYMSPFNGTLRRAVLSGADHGFAKFTYNKIESANSINNGNSHWT